MKIPSNTRLPEFDAAAVQQTIERALAAAGLDTSRGPMQTVTQTIRRAMAPHTATGDPDVIDIDARFVDVDHTVTATTPEPVVEPRPHAMPGGRFESGTFSNRTGARTYKVYVPAGTPATPRPMIVMLHGCTQSADDFAIGTGMNRLADAHGLLVVYPEQPASANPSKCWNWFNPSDQQSDAGEPSIIAGLVRELAARHGADPRRIFVAGLSAGAAMAVVLGQTHPELFTGVGAHSGLPYASAHDIPSALAAMKGGRSGLPGLQNVAGAARKTATRAVPLIVFHGDRDHTVQAVNGQEIVRQAQAAYQATEDGALVSSTSAGVSTGGRRYTRTVYARVSGSPRIESWQVHGAGHAWFGGHPNGSYTDAQGPDASTEMIRFFLQLTPHAPA